MKISFSAIQTKMFKDKYKNITSPNESELIITVEYDPETNTVEGVVSVSCHNWFKNVTTDLTHIFGEIFPDALESIIENIDWSEEYAAREKSTQFEPQEKY